MCLSACVVKYIVHGLPKVNASVDEVPDPKIRGKLRYYCFDKIDPY